MSFASRLFGETVGAVLVTTALKDGAIEVSLKEIDKAEAEELKKRPSKDSVAFFFKGSGASKQKALISAGELQCKLQKKLACPCKKADEKDK